MQGIINPKLPNSFIALMALALSMIITSSCNNDQVNPPSRSAYSFFAAGHVYGKPGVDNDGFHPPFTDIIPYLNTKNDLELGFFTGDIVISDNEENWDQYLIAEEALSTKNYIAAGNHDYKNPELFQSYFGAPNFYFYSQDDLFICLELNTTGWNIQDELFTILNEALATLDNADQNVFLFVHQLVWFAEDTKYTQCYPNSFEGRQGPSNFRTEVLPLLEGIEQQVIIYAGDIGAFENGCAIMYDNFNNIQLIASGMGGGKNDNIVITTVDALGEISFELVALNGDDKTVLGNVEDYWVQ